MQDDCTNSTRPETLKALPGPGEDRRARAWRSSLSPLLLGHALAALLVLGIAGYAMQVSRDTYLQQGEMLAIGRASDFRQEVTTDLERIDLAMRHVALANLRDATDPEVRRRLIDESLREHMALVPEVSNLRQTDAEGVVRFQGADRASLGQQLRDDPVFIQARGTHDDGLLVGEPHLDKTHGRWFLPLAHRVEDHAGQFQGIVIGDLDLNYFDRMIDRRHLDPTDSLSLRSTRLTLLSRQTGRDEQAQPIGTQRISPTFAEMLKTAPLNGVFTARNVFDGVERITAYSTATPFPVMTLAGVSRELVLRPWVTVAWRIGALAAVATLAVLAQSAGACQTVPQLL